jgi:transposase
MWCVAKIDNTYIERMEAILDILAQPINKKEPVLVLDERPVQLLASKRSETTARPGRDAKKDYEYQKCGTANIFCITAPKTGEHLTHATSNRKGIQFAEAMKKTALSYPEAEVIHIIMDNLNTHREISLIRAFGEEEGKLLWKRFIVHYTPKHASWLNPAEIEASLWARECLGRERIASLDELEARTNKWNENAHQQKRKISWKFTTKDAQKIFGYERINKLRSQH